LLGATSGATRAIALESFVHRKGSAWKSHSSMLAGAAVEDDALRADTCKASQRDEGAGGAKSSQMIPARDRFAEAPAMNRELAPTK